MNSPLGIIHESGKPKKKKKNLRAAFKGIKGKTPRFEGGKGKGNRGRESRRESGTCFVNWGWRQPAGENNERPGGNLLVFCIIRKKARETGRDLHTG